MDKKNKKESILKRLIPYGGKKKMFLYLAMICSAVSGVLLLLPMVHIESIVKVLILKGSSDYGFIKTQALYAAMFSLGGLLLYILAVILSHIFAFEVEGNIIRINVERLMNKPLGYFTSIESGRIRNLIIGGAGETHSILAHQLPDIASTLVTPVAVLVLLFIYDYRLGITSLIPIVLAMIFMATMMTEQGKRQRDEYYDSLNNLSAETVEYVRGIPVVKTFGQSFESFERLNKSIMSMKESVLRMCFSWRNKMSLFEAVAGSTAFFLVPVGLFLIIRGEDPHEIVANLVLYLLIGPILGIVIMRSATIQNYLYFAEQALDKIDDALNCKEMDYGTNKAEEGTIEFKNVSFSYDDAPVLKDISFKIEKGQTVALVGKSGGGKSTIAKLAARFYDVNSGKILINGEDIKSYDKNSLMENTAFVFQNSKLFKKSIRENLLMGKENASDKELYAALEKAGATEIIERLEDGLDTVYGSKGTYFSGGEMQRLIIARIFLKDACFIILDEATAFADPENEYIIQNSFKKLSENKTTLLIAHRLSTVVDADKILLIEDGSILEEGSHEELLKKEGAYKKLWDEYQRSVNWKLGGSND